MDETYETVTVEISEDLYKKLQEAGEAEGLTAEEYASKIIEEAHKNGDWDKFIEELSNTTTRIYEN